MICSVLLWPRDCPGVKCQVFIFPEGGFTCVLKQDCLLPLGAVCSTLHVTCLCVQKAERINYTGLFKLLHSVQKGSIVLAYFKCYIQFQLASDAELVTPKQYVLLATIHKNHWEAPLTGIHGHCVYVLPTSKTVSLTVTERKRRSLK